MSLDDLKDYILYEHVFFGLDKLRKNGFITIEKQNEIKKIIEKSCSESSGDAVLEDSTSPKAEPEAEKYLSESREQEHEQCPYCDSRDNDCNCDADIETYDEKNNKGSD